MIIADPAHETTDTDRALLAFARILDTSEFADEAREILAAISEAHEIAERDGTAAPITPEAHRVLVRRLREIADAAERA